MDTILDYRLAGVGKVVVEYVLLRPQPPPDSRLHQPASFAIGPPGEPRDNWGQQPRLVPASIAKVLVRLQEMTDTKGLKPADLLATFVYRRVSPLQARPHLT